MYEVRFHGRGGQGAVMAAQALANAAFLEGNFAVAFPFFGAERRGAPVLAFARVDRNRIRRKTQVYEPDYVVVLDDKLVSYVNVLEGLKNGGMAVINFAGKPEEIDLGREVKTATVDATSIALDILGQPITNSAILGAFSKATGLISPQSMQQGVKEIFGARLGRKAGEKNAEAVKVAYEKTTVGVCKGNRRYKERKRWLPTYRELPLGLATRPTSTQQGLVGPGSFIENKTGSWRTFTPVLDEEKCTNCLLCWFYCPEGCIFQKPEVVGINYDYCKGCGICADVCPPKAIAMERGEEIDLGGTLREG